MPDDLLLYVGQKAFINKDGELLVLKNKNGLNFPGGRIKTGEVDFKESLKREVFEETGLQIDISDAFFTWQTPHRMNEKPTGKIIYLVGFECKYLSGEVALNFEHSGFMWVDKDNYKKLDDGTDYYIAIEKYFTNSKLTSTFVK
jgi:8-oxo-dGTP pyrophosphatase MutT (NUDIX family)